MAILDKIKENLLVTVVSIVLTGSLIFVGTSFISLQETSENVAIRLSAVETRLEDRSQEKEKLDKVIANSTIIEIMERQMNELRVRIRDLERQINKFDISD